MTRNRATRSGVQSPSFVAPPLAASLLVTGSVSGVIGVLTPLRSLSWTQLFVYLAAYMLVVVCAHAAAVWLACKLFSDEKVVVWPLVGELWICVVWLPLLVLLARDGSPWVVLVLPLLSGSAVLVLRRRRPYRSKLVLQHAGTQGLFQPEETPSLLRMLLPNILTAIAIETGLAVLLAGQQWLAGCLFAIGSILLIGSAPSNLVLRRGGMDSPSQSLWVTSLIVWIWTAIACFPFLKYGDVIGGLGRLLGVPAQPVLASRVVDHPHRSGSDYPGVVLLLPSLPHSQISPPISMTSPQRGPLGKQMVIVFDGEYWYFQEPDERPGADALVKHGNPLKALVRSTNRFPLLMAAHQSLGSSIEMDCCSALRVNLVNADNHSGRISVEVLLADTISKRKSQLSLGTQVIPSSKILDISASRPPVQEALTFLLPVSARGAKFDDIRVMIKPDEYRSLASAQVAIQDFVLEP